MRRDKKEKIYTADKKGEARNEQEDGCIGRRVRERERLREEAACGAGILRYADRIPARRIFQHEKARARSSLCKGGPAQKQKVHALVGKPF